MIEELSTELGGLSEALTDQKKIRLALRVSAMNSLARREHSTYELTSKLAKVPDSDRELVQASIRELTEEGLISDQRFAEALCRSKFLRGFGPVRLRYELTQHRIDDELAESTMSEYDDQWLDRLSEVKEKKFGVKPVKDYKSWAKQARFLQSRGFTPEQISAVIPKSF